MITKVPSGNSIFQSFQFDRNYPPWVFPSSDNGCDDLMILAQKAGISIYDHLFSKFIKNTTILFNIKINNWDKTSISLFTDPKPEFTDFHPLVT